MNILISKLSFIVFLVSIFASTNTFGQKEKEKGGITTLTYVNTDAVLKKVYTKEELELLLKCYLI